MNVEPIWELFGFGTFALSNLIGRFDFCKVIGSCKAFPSCPAMLSSKGVPCWDGRFKAAAMASAPGAGTNPCG